MVLIQFRKWAWIFHGLWGDQRTIIDSWGPRRFTQLALLNFSIWIANKTRPCLIITFLSIFEGLKYGALAYFQILFRTIIIVVCFALNIRWREGLHLPIKHLSPILLIFLGIMSTFNLLDQLSAHLFIKVLITAHINVLIWKNMLFDRSQTFGRCRLFDAGS